MGQDGTDYMGQDGTVSHPTPPMSHPAPYQIQCFIKWVCRILREGGGEGLGVQWQIQEEAFFNVKLAKEVLEPPSLSRVGDEPPPSLAKKCGVIYKKIIAPPLKA